ncbi:Outer membrane efflux protein [Caballeronia udeis]|uniref:Outer membrane efflux protein n=1 Tax=Caballeronia udeis TaxID=1232866 RepID=A0A158JPQ5_9BURK|nr:TolC family protein [Caballeronia udeis]SAL70852.1 Outer membrane efflux protein [Caballeronia udeis]
MKNTTGSRLGVARSKASRVTVQHREAAVSVGRIGLTGATLLSAMLLAACAVKPEPISQAEHLKRAQDDYKTLYSTYVPLTEPLTLSDAIARALKYNYDAQLAKTEETLQDRQLDLAMAQMLPRLAANAGYSWRNNDNAAQSIDEFTRARSLDYSFSESPSHATASLELSWNLLDFGVSYYQAKQQGYRTYVAVERRRKVIDGLVKSTQEAYWKAVAADRLLPRLRPLLVDAQHMLDAGRQASRENLVPPLQGLDYQQNMLSVVGQLKHMQTDLNTATVQLASLINVPGDTPIQFAPMDLDMLPPNSAVDPRKLEEIGLAMRPELREEAYQEKIDQQDVYKEIIKMLPGVGILGSLNYDTNRYLFNPNWAQLGVNASFNLMSLIEGPKAIAAAKTSVQVSHQRRLALSVAVLTQVNLSYQDYLASAQELDIAKQINDVEQKIRVASANASQAQEEPEADRVRRELASMVSEFTYDRSIAQVHTALTNLYTSVGVDLVPPNADTDDLPTLSRRVKAAIAGWEAGKLPELAMLTPAPATTPAGAAVPVAAALTEETPVTAAPMKATAAAPAIAQTTSIATAQIAPAAK